MFPEFYQSDSRFRSRERLAVAVVRHHQIIAGAVGLLPGVIPVLIGGPVPLTRMRMRVGNPPLERPGASYRQSPFCACRMMMGADRSPCFQDSQRPAQPMVTRRDEPPSGPRSGVSSLRQRPIGAAPRQPVLRDRAEDHPADGKAAHQRIAAATRKLAASSASGASGPRTTMRCAFRQVASIIIVCPSADSAAGSCSIRGSTPSGSSASIGCKVSSVCRIRGAVAPEKAITIAEYYAAETATITDTGAVTAPWGKRLRPSHLRLRQPEEGSSAGPSGLI